MTKKILAMFLAVLMVISVLPASVLAAKEECPLAGKPHNLDNCTDYSVVSSADANCTSGAYTLYKCNLCKDVTFIGNQSAPLGHLESKLVTEAKDPTFTEKGNYAKYHCDRCGKDWEKVEAEQAIDVYDRDYAFECPKGGACSIEHVGYPCDPTGMTSKCQKCDRTIVSFAPHDPNYDEIVFGEEDGIPTAPCKVCEDEAVVITIDPLHYHILGEGARDTIKFVDEKFDCINGNVAAHYECVICGAVFEKDLDVYDQLVPTTLEELTEEDPIGYHTRLPGETKTEAEKTRAEDKKATCTTDGVEVYDCAVCEEEIVEVIPAQHKWTDETKVNPTCGVDGFVTHTCEICEFKETKILEARSQHTTLAEYEAAIAAIGNSVLLENVDPDEMFHEDCYQDNDVFLKDVVYTGNCETETGIIASWNCLNCGQTVKQAIAAGHKWVKQEVAATCSRGAYSFEYCANSYCNKAPVSALKAADAQMYTTTVEVTTLVVEPITVTIRGVEYTIGYEKVEVTNVVPAVVKDRKINILGTTLDKSNHTYSDPIESDPTCTTEGIYYKKCSGCGDVVNVTVPALGHNGIFLSYNPPAKCNGTDKGTAYYKCLTCGEIYTKTKIAYTININFATKEAAELVHVLGSEVVDSRVGDCDVYGYTAYKCTVCNNTITIEEEGTGTGHTDFIEQSVEVPATETRNPATVIETLTFEASPYNTAGYMVTINAKINGAVATGLIPNNGIEIGGEKFTQFGVEQKVDYDGAALAAALKEGHFFVYDEEDPTKDYIIDEYIITVKYYVITAPTCDSTGSEAAHYCINEHCTARDAELVAKGEQARGRYEFDEITLKKLSHVYVTIQDAVYGVHGEMIRRPLTVCVNATLGGYCMDVKDLKEGSKVIEADYYDGDYHYDNYREGTGFNNVSCKNQTPQFDLYYCDECKVMHIVNLKPTVPHTWGEGFYKEGDEPTCTEKGTLTYLCTVCGEAKTKKTATAPHVNAAGEEFYQHCEDTVTDRHCVLCCAPACKTGHSGNDKGKLCNEIKDSSGNYVCDCMIPNAHSVNLSKLSGAAKEAYWVDATCAAAGYYKAECAYCKVAQIQVPTTHNNLPNVPAGHVAVDYKTKADFYYKDTTTVNEPAWERYQAEHQNVGGLEYKKYVAPTAEAEGIASYECHVCGANVVDEVLPRLKDMHFSLVASNAARENCFEYAPFSLIAVSVKTGGVDAKLSSFSFDVSFTGKLQYVGYEMTNGKFIGSATTAEKVKKDNLTSIKVVGNVIGAEQVEVKDETLVTLYFRVLEDADVVDFDFTVNAKNALGDITAENANFNDQAEITINKFMDVDGEEMGTDVDTVLADLQEAINIIYGLNGNDVDYNVAADLNRNGILDLEDVRLMCQAASGSIDMKDVRLLNLFEGEADLWGICLECEELGGVHTEKCSEYKKPQNP